MLTYEFVVILYPAGYCRKRAGILQGKEGISRSMKTSEQAITSDRIGMWLSGVCLVHCVATPFLVALSPALAHFLPGDETVHRFLSVGILLIGSLAFVKGWRRHRRISVLVLLLLGMSIIITTAFCGGLFPSHLAETAVTIIGSSFLVFAHYRNNTFCGRCEECEHVPRSEA